MLGNLLPGEFSVDHHKSPEGDFDIGSRSTENREHNLIASIEIYRRNLLERYVKGNPFAFQIETNTGLVHEYGILDSDNGAAASFPNRSTVFAVVSENQLNRLKDGIAVGLHSDEYPARLTATLGTHDKEGRAGATQEERENGYRRLNCCGAPQATLLLA